jgi:peptide subunit release factor 1 (eRF1)
MKNFYRLLLLLFIYHYSQAEDIDAQIEAIMQMKGQERVDRMNRLKSQIAAMNEQERENALQTLQGKMQQSRSQQRKNQENGMNFFGGMQHQYQNNTQQPNRQGQR